MLFVADRMLPAAHALLNPNEAMMIDDAILGFRPNPSVADHDEWGFRNDAVPERVELVALGDSLTYGAMVAAEDAWPQQLERVLGITTYNMAFGGYGPAHEALLVDEALQLRPRLVILAMYAGNDLFDSFNLVYHHEHLSADRSSDPVLRRQIAILDREASITARVDGQSGSGGWSVGAWLRESSGVYALARATRNVIRGSIWRFQDRGWNQAKALGDIPGNNAFESDGVHTIFTVPKRLAALDLEDVRIREGLRIALESIARAATATKNGGARFAVLLLPTKENVFAREVRSAPGATIDGFEALVANEQSMWKSTRKFLDDRHIATIDALPALQGSLAMRHQPYRADDDGHMNPIGNAVVAKLVQRKIEELSLLRDD